MLHPDPDDQRADPPRPRPPESTGDRVSEPDVPRAAADAIVRTIAATVHGRYLVARPADGPAGLLVGFHGYGESAETHLAHLRQLPSAAIWTVVSVQGLHRFYNRRQSVIASWMTSQDRELAIADNIAYARDVVARVIEETMADTMDEERPPPRLVYVGFSQGTAMACRAAAYAGHQACGLVLLGGDIPPEICEDETASLPPVLLGRGRRDDWYTQAKLDDDLAWLERRGIPAEAAVFDGGHEWTDEFREAAGQFIAKLV